MRSAAVVTRKRKRVPHRCGGAGERSVCIPAGKKTKKESRAGTRLSESHFSEAGRRLHPAGFGILRAFLDNAVGHGEAFEASPGGLDAEVAEAVLSGLQAASAGGIDTEAASGLNGKFLAV